MASRTNPEWRFAKPGDGMVAGGDITKAFRGESRPLPGFLDALDPGSSARLFTRELIQNAVDARADHERDCEARGVEPGPRLSLEFEFETVSAKDIASFSQMLDLATLDQRVDEIGAGELGLVEANYFEGGDADRPVRVLRVTERFTSGMYGPWSHSDERDYPRRMHSALLSLGTTDKTGDAGGSYGYGKAGLATASKVRTVVVYTCFRERPDESDDVTRRLLGVSYWGEHRYQGRRYLGYGTLGAPAAQPDLSEPLRNSDADTAAAALGFQVRDPSVPEDLGTSYLVIDPDFGPAELQTALELFWWPALEAGRFDVRIQENDGSGGEFPPRPRKVDGLSPFWQTFEWVRGQAPAPASDFAECAEFNRVTIDGKQYAVGKVGLLVDENDGESSWSWTDSTEKSLVALVRATHMVVSYFEVDTGLPQARGVFLAAADADPLLRQSEPKAHDDWQHRRDSGIADDARAMAETVKERIRRRVASLTKPLRPRPSLESVFLDEFSRFFKGPTGQRPTTGEPTADPWTIELSTEPDDSLPSDQRFLRLKAEVSVGLSANAPEAAIGARVLIRFGALEEASTFNADGLTCSVEAPPGWKPDGSTPEEAVFVGTLTPDKAVFRARSCEFPAEWTGAFRATVEPAAVLASEASTEGTAT